MLVSVGTKAPKNAPNEMDCFVSLRIKSRQMEFSKVIKDPTLFLQGRNVPPELYSHITVNPELSRLHGAQFDIVREATHDGSGNFTEDLFKEVLLGIVNKRVYFKPEGREPVGYEVGLLRWSTVYGYFDINGVKMHGQRERMRLPVKCIYN